MIRKSLIIENLQISFKSIRSNLLRTILTVLIISVGIMALVGILTAVESIKSTIIAEFQRMGSNTFTIRQESISRGQDQGRGMSNVRISFNDAVQFKRDYSFPAIVSINIRATGNATLKSETHQTEPNIAVLGVDENYLICSGEEIMLGRNFLPSEINTGANLVIIGSELANSLFPGNINPIDKFISIGNLRYRVIGVLSEKGTSFGGNGDRLCLITLHSQRMNFQSSSSYIINVMPDNPANLDMAISEAEGIFRNIRRLTVFDNSNFRITKSDNLVTMMFDNIRIVTVGATIIGIITLLGASVGLMNIMLVSVSERTREIGTRKAIGATPKAIKQQFLFEAIIIGQLGGYLGILLGILAGNLISLITGGVFVIPWLWVIVGIVLCGFVGISSGYVPAVKASKLDPIEALRHE